MEVFWCIFIIKIQDAYFASIEDFCALQQYDEHMQHTWSVRKVSDLIFLCEHLTDYNLARLHEPTLNLSAHA